MSTIEHSEDVRVPVRVAYDQWTQFESFPEFMEGVESVKQLSDTRTAWVADIAGVRREFEAEITEQHPDERVAWRSVERPPTTPAW
ncbi:SRPBCC family protein [Nonomuraea salmonea]|uniref:SRPBCC family protein n=1 Tax=Nonomuraea salmonea TaxID=46181 RepID=UPI0031EB6C1F